MTEMRMIDKRMMPDTLTDAVRSPKAATGLELTLEETLVLQALWLHAERVDWAVYERLRMRIIAWPFPASPSVTVKRSD